MEEVILMGAERKVTAIEHIHNDDCYTKWYGRSRYLTCYVPELRIVKSS